MLARSHLDCQENGWKQELKEAITNPDELLQLLGLDRTLLAQTASKRLRLLVPRGFARLMKTGDPHDPLLRQVLPVAEELHEHSGFVEDPLFEGAQIDGTGLLRKYQGRALLLVTGACAVHCRYCFRRHVQIIGDGARRERLANAVEQLARDPSVAEVILSGGDPLLLDDPALADLVATLERLPHLRRLRVHSRLPVVLPSRITDSLCSILTRSLLKPILVVHTNHAQELGPASRDALGRLHRSGVTLLNQSVLLRGVNDSAHSLADLSEALFESAVLPYYLHLLDKVAGASHFELDDTQAVELFDDLRGRLPGYLVPRLVREVAGRPYKDLIDLKSADGVANQTNTGGTGCAKVG